MKALGVDLLSISAHKIYGPKGVGAIWIRRGLRLSAADDRRQARAQPPRGDGERGRDRRLRRGGRISHAHIRPSRRCASPRCAIASSRVSSPRVTGTAVNGGASPRVPNTTNISFDRVEAESLLIALDLEGVAVSTGSACSSGTLEPSHVLKAMGFPAHRTQNSIRFSLGASNTEAQIDHVIAILPARRGQAPFAHEGVRREPDGLALCARAGTRHLGHRMKIVVAMSGGVDSSVAAARLAAQGHDIVGLSMQLYDQRGGETLRPLLLARRSARRPARGRDRRLPALHRQLRAAVPRDRHRRLRARVRRRAHADPVRPLQQRSEVLHSARSRPRPGRHARRHRTLRPRDARGRRPVGAAPRRRSRQGPVVFPVLADTGAARRRACFPSAI